MDFIDFFTHQRKKNSIHVSKFGNCASGLKKKTKQTNEMKIEHQKKTNGMQLLSNKNLAVCRFLAKTTSMSWLSTIDSFVRQRKQISKITHEHQISQQILAKHMQKICSYKYMYKRCFFHVIYISKEFESSIHTKELFTYVELNSTNRCQRIEKNKLNLYFLYKIK